MFKSIILAISAVVGFACAQGGVPACATSCIVLPTQCNGNPSCICSDTQWISNISCCIFKACDTADQQQALQYAQTICTPVGATLPAAASCNGTSSTTNGTASSSASSSASTTKAAASSSSSASAKSSATGSFGNKLVVDSGVGIVGAMLGVAVLF